MDSRKSNKNKNYLLSANIITSTSTDSTISSIYGGEEMNKNFSTDSSSTLSIVFKGDSMQYIAILMFFTLIEIILFVSNEFIIIINHINILEKKINFFYNGFTIYALH